MTAEGTTRVLTVLKMLAMRRRIAFVAAAMELYPNQVRAIAEEHGALRADGEVDFAAAGHAADELERTVITASVQAIPVREPAEVKQHAAPPVRVATPATPARASTTPAPKPTPRPVPEVVRPVEIVEVAHARPSTPGPPRPAGGDELMTVRVDQVHPDPDNPRESVGDVTELAESLKVVGLLQPIVVRRVANGSLLIVAGHRRHAAARLAGWTLVQVIVRRDMRPDDVLAAMLVENSHRKDLDAIEEARGLARLKAQLGASDAAVARRVGRSSAHVAARLMLLALPIEEQEEIRRGEMTLVEAGNRAKLASGRGLATGPARGMPHLSSAHPLAELVRARCRRLGHSRGKGQSVGGLGCGRCWESTIRADERQHLHEHSGRVGQCAICGTAYTPAIGLAQ